MARRWPFFALAIVSVFSTRANQSLFPDPVYPSGVEPSSMAGGDLNDDGLPDLVVAGSDGLILNVLLNRGGGRFSRAVLPAWVPRGLAVADVDRDGRPDIVVTTGGAISFFGGNGDGTFAEAVESTYEGALLYLQLGDVDEDGTLDLVTSNWFGGSAAVLPGNGDGTFDSAVVDASARAWRTGLGHLDDDGHLDLVAGYQGFSFHFGRGDGTFEHRTDLDLAFSANSIGIADLEDDGHPDVVAVDRFAGDVVVIRGLGQRAFEEGVRYAIPDLLQVAGPEHVEIVDLDRDGALDLVVGNDSAEFVSVFYGRGDGSFESGVNFATITSGGPIVVDDYTGDGRLDIAVASWARDTVFLLEGTGHREFAPPGRTEIDLGDTIGAQATDMVAADLDRDGLADAAFAVAGDDAVRLLYGTPGGGFADPVDLPAGDEPGAIGVGDLDGDGWLDLITLHAASLDGSVFLGDAQGGFEAEIRFPLGVAPAGLAVADCNQDLEDDIVVLGAAPGFEVLVLFSNGDGTFVDGPTLAAGGEPSGVLALDVNDDERVDVVLTLAGSEEVSVSLSTGGGTFLPAVNSAVGFPAVLAVAGRIDADDLMDLVVAERYGVGLRFLPGLGDGTFGAATTIDTPGQPSESTSLSSLDLGDLDGDGRLDLALGHGRLSGVSVALGRGDGTFLLEGTYGAPEWPVAVAVRGATDDGWSDLLVTSRQRLSVLPFRGPDSLQFAANRSTLGWPADVLARSYDVYRGLLSTLHDLDGDGLPDSGYGDCRSDTDPDLTDCRFLDLERPPRGEGFYYLVAAVDDEGTSDLGTTSRGLARIPGTPCALPDPSPLP